MLQSSSTEKINSADLDQIREILADTLVDTKDAVVNLETAMMNSQPEFNKTQQDHAMGDMGNEVQSPNDEVATNQQIEANSGKPVLNEQKVKSQSELNMSEPVFSNETVEKSEPVEATYSQSELKKSKSELAEVKVSKPALNEQNKSQPVLSNEITNKSEPVLNKEGTNSQSQLKKSKSELAEVKGSKPALNEQNKSQPVLSNETVEKSEPVEATNSQSELKKSKSELAEVKGSKPALNEQKKSQPVLSNETTNKSEPVLNKEGTNSQSQLKKSKSELAELKGSKPALNEQNKSQPVLSNETTNMSEPVLNKEGTNSQSQLKKSKSELAEVKGSKPALNEQKVKSQSELNSSELAISNEAAKKSEPILAMNSQAELKTSKSNLADMKSSMPFMNTQIGIVGDDFKESINSLTKDTEIKNDFKKSDPALEYEAKEQQEAVEISSSNASELV
jgi:hypothetical protein